MDQNGMNRTVFYYDEMDRVILEQDIYYDKAAGTWKPLMQKQFKKEADS